MWGVLSVYFSCVMIRLMLTLAPIACILGGIALSEIFTMVGASARQTYQDFMKETDEQVAAAKEKEEQAEIAQDIADGNPEEAASKKAKAIAKRVKKEKKSLDFDV